MPPDYFLGPLRQILDRHFTKSALTRFYDLSLECEVDEPSLYPLMSCNTFEEMLYKAPEVVDRYSQRLIDIVFEIEGQTIRKDRSNEHFDRRITSYLCSLQSELELTEWMVLIGEYYIYIDCSSDLTKQLLTSARLAGRVGFIPELMADWELAALQNFRFPLKGYRGCIENVNEDGLSYSTQRDWAIETLSNFCEVSRGGCGVLNRAKFVASEVAAFKNIRGEYELLVYGASNRRSILHWDYGAPKTAG